ncbi:hypothetical protein WJX77_007782 [Trebouxia sp. C0004]
MSDSSAANVAINASPELPACFAPGDEGLLGLRLGGLFGILVVSTIGVFIPFFTYKAKLASVYFLLRAFAAGVVLTTGYVHVLGDAFPILTDPCLARTDSNDDVAKAADRKVRLKALQNVVISYTFEAGIIFHSIFIGITLGISSNADTATTE